MIGLTLIMDRALVMSTADSALFNIAIPRSVLDVPFLRFASCTMSVPSLAHQRALLSANMKEISKTIACCIRAFLALRLHAKY